MVWSLEGEPPVHNQNISDCLGVGSQLSGRLCIDTKKWPDLLCTSSHIETPKYPPSPVPQVTIQHPIAPLMHTLILSVLARKTHLLVDNELSGHGVTGKSDSDTDDDS